MILWVGTSVPPKVLEDLFGVDDIALIDPRMVSIIFHESRMSLLTWVVIPVCLA